MRCGAFNSKTDTLRIGARCLSCERNSGLEDLQIHWTESSDEVGIQPRALLLGDDPITYKADLAFLGDVSMIPGKRHTF